MSWVQIDSWFQETIEFDELERKLSYEDIRFYRSISRSELKKEKKKLEEQAAEKGLQALFKVRFGFTFSTSTTTYQVNTLYIYWYIGSKTRDRVRPSRNLWSRPRSQCRT